MPNTPKGLPIHLRTLKSRFVREKNRLLTTHNLSITNRLLRQKIEKGLIPEGCMQFIHEEKRYKNSKKTELYRLRNRFKGRTNLKNLVMQRDKHTCRICGSKQNIEVDHIKPLSKYTSLAFEPSNLQALCRSCNRKKHATE